MPFGLATIGLPTGREAARAFAAAGAGKLAAMPSMKDTIRRVAIDLFYRKGYFATSISQIAAGSGIRKASLYHHYPSKEALLFHILQVTMDDLVDSLHASLAGIEAVEARMRAAVRMHVRFHLQRQKETFIASSELRGLTDAHCRSIVDRRDAYERIFQGIITDGHAGRVFADGDMKILSYAILTLCTAGASWFKPDGRLAVDEIATIYEDFIISGLKRAELAAAEGAMPPGAGRRGAVR